MAAIKVRPMTSFDRFCDLHLFGILLLLTCVITIWAPTATGSSRTCVRDIPHTDTEAPSPLLSLVQFCT